MAGDLVTSSWEDAPAKTQDEGTHPDSLVTDSWDEKPAQSQAAEQPAVPIEPNAQQRRMGIRVPRVKDDHLLQNMADARSKAVYDVGGKVTDVTGSPLLGAGANVAADVVSDPLTYIGGKIGEGAASLLQAGGRRVMQAALKPNKAARDSGDAAKAVRTLLEDGINVSEGGVAKLTEKIDALDQQLTDAIANSTGKIKDSDLLKSLKKVLEAYKDGTNQAKTIPEIEAVGKRLLEHSSVSNGEMSVQAAQAMKRQNYKELRGSYGKPGGNDAETDALKAVTHDLRTGIEAAAPETAGINAQMSPLVNARNLADQRVSVAGNNNLLGLGLLNPKTLAYWLADRSPLAQSLLARLLHSGAAPMAPVAAATVGAGLGLEANQRPGIGLNARGP